jgi:hypothetical protein
VAFYISWSLGDVWVSYQDMASVVWPRSAASADKRKGTIRGARTSPGCQGRARLACWRGIIRGGGRSAWGEDAD